MQIRTDENGEPVYQIEKRIGAFLWKVHVKDEIPVEITGEEKATKFLTLLLNKK